MQPVADLRLVICMDKLCFKRRLEVSQKAFLAVFLLVNSLTWWFWERQNISVIFEKTISISQKAIIFAASDFLIICSSIIGAAISNRVRKSTILHLWVIFGTISSILIFLLPSLPLSYAVLVILIWAISFGFGMPSCLTFFADITRFENRGSVAGLIFFISSATTPAIITVSTSFVLSALAAVIWRGLCSMVLIVTKMRENITGNKQPSFVTVVTNKQLLLYLVPWLMFSFIYGFQKVTIEHAIRADLYESLRIIQSISGTISAIISGLFCDRIGRKRVVIYGFVSLGISYAVVSVAPNSLLSLYFYSIIDGISWGIFIVMFVLVLWGDISSITSHSREKYYAIGGIPFFLADLIGFILKPHLQIEVNAAFSVASFFLFLAVVPLMYASETLPEKIIRRKELERYIKEAKKIREKYEKQKEG